ncbi:MAG: glycosyltransferase family 2 protein [Chloroflexi bacterium]|nr:MAG: glycosyltransferase family 2 protein [Chloroflexota bacterium]
MNIGSDLVSVKPQKIVDNRTFPYMSVWIVVLTWNNYADTFECLRSLRALTYPNYHVVVVDNASNDGTPVRVRSDFPEVHLIENAGNLGVPAGYNVGFRYALEHGADGVVMLNNDTAVSPDLLHHLVHAAQHPQAGILVPTAFYFNAPTKIWSAGGRYRWFPPAIIMEKRRQRPGDPLRVLEYAIGSCILITRRAFEQAGLLDETYFFMWEDLDLSVRIRKAGLLILGVPQAALWHKVSQSTQPESPLFWRMHGRSGAIYYRRHSAVPYLAMVLHLGYFALREFLAKRQRHFIPPFLKGIGEGLIQPLKEFPQIQGRRGREDQRAL